MTDKDDKHTGDTGGSAEDRLGAVLGLLADNEAPLGEKPDLLEIQAWQLSKLDAQRATEVKSHIARDADCYQMWSDLQAASMDAPVLQKTTWLQVIVNTIIQKIQKPVWVGGLATALLVVLVVILILPSKTVWSPMDDPVHTDITLNWPYLAMSVTRGGNLNYQHKIALQNGIREGIKLTTQGKQGWQAAIDNLPEQLPGCDKNTASAQCEKQNQLIKNVGLHAGVLYMACLDTESTIPQYFDTAFWENQNQAWQRLSTELQQYKLNDIDTVVNKIKQDDINYSPTSQANQCEAVRDLIYLSY